MLLLLFILDKHHCSATINLDSLRWKVLLEADYWVVFGLGSAITFLCQISAGFGGMVKGAFVALEANAAEAGFNLIVLPFRSNFEHESDTIESRPPRNIMTLTTGTREQPLSLLVLLDSLLLSSLVVVITGRRAVVEALLLSHDGLLAFLQKI